MLEENLSRKVLISMNPIDYDNMKKNLQNGQKVSAFVRQAISNEIQRLETYNKEKNQTWDIE